jgi:hypothetical protein
MIDSFGSRANTLLDSFIGKAILATEVKEYRLGVTFDDGSHFVTTSPWRLSLGPNLLMGSGDVGAKTPVDALNHPIGLKVESTSISGFWDTRLQLENNYLLEVFSNSIQYETWEAHVEAGWVVFAGGGTTVFPPSSVAAAAAGEER